MEPTNEMIDAWFAQHFHGLGLLLDTALYNRIHAAKDDLKARLGIVPPAVEDSPAATSSEDAAAADTAEEA